MERITPAQLIWVMVVNGGHCTRKIPERGREMRRGGESLEEIGREGELPLCHGIIVVLRVELCQGTDNDTIVSDSLVYQYRAGSGVGFASKSQDVNRSLKWTLNCKVKYQHQLFNLCYILKSVRLWLFFSCPIHTTPPLGFLRCNQL